MVNGDTMKIGIVEITIRKRKDEGSKIKKAIEEKQRELRDALNESYISTSTIDKKKASAFEKKLLKSKLYQSNLKYVKNVGTMGLMNLDLAAELFHLEHLLSRRFFRNNKYIAVIFALITANLFILYLI